MESSDNLALRHKTFTYHRQYYSMVDISFLWEGGGQYIMVKYIAPPLQKYSRTEFCKWNPVTTSLLDTKHLHITDNTIRRLTFFMGYEGGSILWYIILTPPSKNIQEQHLYMESSDNLASTHKTVTYHRQY